MVSLYRDPKGENVFSNHTTIEPGEVLGIKQVSDINLTGFRTNLDKSLGRDESAPVLRARVCDLEKQLAEVKCMELFLVVISS